jgi:hypothetical protein
MTTAEFDVLSAIKVGIADFFRDADYHNINPGFTKSEAFSDIIDNHSLKEIRYHYDDDKLSNDDVSSYIFEILYWKSIDNVKHQW